MSQERINMPSLHFMVETVIEEIDKGNVKINEFQFEGLFINIFYCFYFIKFLSPYYVWQLRVIKILKRNIKKKWLKSLPNIDFFMKQLEIKNDEVDPLKYWYHSEDYFEKLISQKEIADILFFRKKKKKNKKKYFKVYKPIR